MTFGPINTLPIGFANLFGMTGQNMPKGFEEVITPILDMLPFFAQANCREIVDSGSVVVSAVGSSALLTVPQEEGWLVLGAAASWNATAAQYIRGQLNLLRGDISVAQSAIYRTLAQASSNEAGAVVGPVTNVMQVGYQGLPFMLYGGDSIIFTCNALIAGPVTVNCKAPIFRFTL